MLTDEFHCPFKQQEICPETCPVLLEAIKFASGKIKSLDQLAPVVRVFLEKTAQMTGDNLVLAKASCEHTPVAQN